MFGIGGFEFFLILIFAFLIFGPERLPEMAKTLGRAIAKFKAMKNELDDVVKTEIYEPQAQGVPYENPLQALEELASPTQLTPQDKERIARREKYEQQRAQLKEKAARAQAEAAAAKEDDESVADGADRATVVNTEGASLEEASGSEE